MHDLLRGRRILVVEDEYLLAVEVRDAVQAAGAEVVGPVASVDAARRLVDRVAMIDGAVLDVNLGGELAYPIADALRMRGVPFAFATGYGAEILPARFSSVPRIEKPVRSGRVAEVLGVMVGGTPADPDR